MPENTNIRDNINGDPSTRMIIFILTISINWALYSVMVIEGVEINISNITSWLVSMLSAFVMYKLFIIKNSDYRLKTVFGEFKKFFFMMMVLGIITIAFFPTLYHLGLNQSVVGIDGLLAKIIVTIMEIVFNRL